MKKVIKITVWCKSLFLAHTSSRHGQTQEMAWKIKATGIKIINLSFIFLSLGCNLAVRGVPRWRVTRLYKILVQVFKIVGKYLLTHVCPLSRITSAQLTTLEVNVIQVTNLFMLYVVKSLGQGRLCNWFRNACWLMAKQMGEKMFLILNGSCIS